MCLYCVLSTHHRPDFHLEVGSFLCLFGFDSRSEKFFQLFLKNTNNFGLLTASLVEALFRRHEKSSTEPWKQNNHSSDTFQSGGESLSGRCDTPRPTCPKGRLRIARWTANPGHIQMLGCAKHGDETLWDNDTSLRSWRRTRQRWNSYDTD